VPHVSGRVRAAQAEVAALVYYPRVSYVSRSFRAAGARVSRLGKVNVPRPFTARKCNQPGEPKVSKRVTVASDCLVSYPAANPAACKNLSIYFSGSFQDAHSRPRAVRGLNPWTVPPTSHLHLRRPTSTPPASPSALPSHPPPPLGESQP